MLTKRERRQRNADIQRRWRANNPERFLEQRLKWQTALKERRQKLAERKKNAGIEAKPVGRPPLKALTPLQQLEHKSTLLNRHLREAYDRQDAQAVSQLEQEIDALYAQMDELEKGSEPIPAAAERHDNFNINAMYRAFADDEEE